MLMRNGKIQNVLFHGKALILLYLIAALSLNIALPAGVYAKEKIWVRWIGVDQLARVMREKSPVVIDLRTPFEYQQNRLPGAINIPIEDLISNRTLLDFYKERHILLYCRTINKTRMALWFLEDRSFQLIYALEGGYEAYQRKGQ
ncbi:MAG: rhodanese-like domain-containing protein [Syntrophaceae bacterium]|nr:rhodanese-like domain-containing protein [Syntrophaceae bacterium]